MLFLFVLEFYGQNEQKMKFFIKDFFNKCYHIRSFLRFGGYIYWRNF